MRTKSKVAGLLAALVLVAGTIHTTAPAALAAAPSNDAFANAQPLSGALPIIASGTNVDATAETGEPDHDGDPADHSVWYSWTPSASATVIIEACAGPLLARVGVYTGAAVDALTEVGVGIAPPPSCHGGFDPAVRLDATAGTTYRIAIDGFAADEDAFELRIRVPSPPPNDAFTGAQTLAGPMPISIAGTNADATKEPGEPNHAGNQGGSSVWYAWTAPTSGPFAIDPCDADFPTLLGVYTGGAVGSLTEITSGFGFGSCDAAMIDAAAGTTYRIAVDGVLTTGGISQGAFNLEIRALDTPANDAFADAQAIEGSPPIIVNGTNVDATKEPSEPDHAGFPGGASVWYTWTPTVSDTITLDTCASNFDTILAVYTGDSVGSLTEIASNDDHAFCNFKSVVTFEATAGTTYHIAVDGFFGTIGGGTGSIVLEFGAPPPNDDFGDAKVVDGALPILMPGTTALASKQSGEPNHAGNIGGHSVWYAWTPTSSGTVTIDVCDTDVQMLLAVYTGSDLGSLTEIESNRGGCGDGAFVALEATAGTTYRIAVDSFTGSFGSSFGPFTLQIKQPSPPPNDDLANAETLSGTLPIAVSGANIDASKEAGEPNHTFNSGGASVWYRWTAGTSGTVAIDTCGSDFDTLLAVYTGAGITALTKVASNDDFNGCGTDSHVSFPATAGTEYRIAVDGFSRAMGLITLHLRVEAPPANDDFAEAEQVDGPLPLSVGGTNMDATNEPGEPNHAGNTGSGSVWFSWTADRPGPVVIDTCASTFDTLLAVYAGAALESLTTVASNDDDESCGRGSLVTFDAAGGTTYRIAIDGWASTFDRVSYGYFDLSIASACTQTFTGSHDGTLKASDGITCLEGVTLEGPLRIDDGAQLWAVDSDIVGPVTANGADKVVLCGSTIEGPVKITGSGSVLLGDPNLGCASNDIDGPVTLTATSGLSVVAGNHITGKLACSKNAPPPVDRGVPNIVLGPATGQCKGLAE